MVNIFAREITDDLASLVKEMDEVVGKNEKQKMAGFFVLLSEDPDAAEKKLKELAEKHKIKNIPLTVFDGAAGPGNYKIAKDADVTVLMWQGRQQEVKVNHSFRKKELDKEAVKKVVKDAAKIGAVVDAKEDGKKEREA